MIRFTLEAMQKIRMNLKEKMIKYLLYIFYNNKIKGPEIYITKSAAWKIYEDNSEGNSWVPEQQTDNSAQLNGPLVE